MHKYSDAFPGYASASEKLKLMMIKKIKIIIINYSTLARVVYYIYKYIFGIYDV